MSETDGKLICIPVPPDYVGAVWGQVEGYLEAAIKTARGKCTVDDVRAEIDTGLYLLWVVVDDGELIAAITTRIIEYPRCRAMALDWIGGKRIKDWIGMSNRIMMEHAKNNGCTHLEGYGRPAWIRLNGKYGWKEDYTTFRLEV
jgi:hypothetical protein